MYCYKPHSLWHPFIVLPFSRSDFPGGSDGQASAYNQETWVQSLGWEDLLEKEMATHSSILAWKIPWMEEPGRLYSPWGHEESDMTEWLHFLSLGQKCNGLGGVLCLGFYKAKIQVSVSLGSYLKVLGETLVSTLVSGSFNCWQNSFLLTVSTQLLPSSNQLLESSRLACLWLLLLHLSDSSQESSLLLRAHMIDMGSSISPE